MAKSLGAIEDASHSLTESYRCNPGFVLKSASVY
jgi:hypothetical protein